MGHDAGQPLFRQGARFQSYYFLENNKYVYINGTQYTPEDKNICNVFQGINSCIQPLLEIKLPGVIYPMPKRNNKDVYDFIEMAIENGWMGEDNWDKYEQWSSIPPNVRRKIPGTNIYEKGDPPMLA